MKRVRKYVSNEKIIIVIEREKSKYQDIAVILEIPSKLFFRYDVASSDLHLEERTKGRKNLLLERWRGRKFRGGGQALLQELNWKGKQIPLDQTTLVNR